MYQVKLNVRTDLVVTRGQRPLVGFGQDTSKQNDDEGAEETPRRPEAATHLSLGSQQQL